MCSIARQKRGLDSQSDDPSSEVRLWVLMGKGVGLLEVVSVAGTGSTRVISANWSMTL